MRSTRMAGALFVTLFTLGGFVEVAQPVHHSIRMDTLWPYYHPSVATFAPSTPIEWHNPTSIPHSVVHDSCAGGGRCAFDSGHIQPDESYRIQGLPQGRYPYHCALHPRMRGVLLVDDAAVRTRVFSEKGRGILSGVGLELIAVRSPE